MCLLSTGCYQLWVKIYDFLSHLRSIFSFCFIVITKIPSRILGWTVDRWQSYFIPDLKETLSFLTFILIVPIILFRVGFILLMYNLSFSVFHSEHVSTPKKISILFFLFFYLLSQISAMAVSAYPKKSAFLQQLSRAISFLVRDAIFWVPILSMLKFWVAWACIDNERNCE